MTYSAYGLHPAQPPPYIQRPHTGGGSAITAAVFGLLGAVVLLFAALGSFFIEQTLRDAIGESASMTLSEADVLPEWFGAFTVVLGVGY